MALLTRWWIWMIVLPFAAGTMLFFLVTRQGLPEDAMFYAAWGQSVGAFLPIGVFCGLLALVARYVLRKKEGR
ncbi:hypothetical protein [Leisingera sp. ANG59]|uniref:hypothetical protein n=1 Tax=Leisingera sp. ANG59 TaxID=2675221 RepID=UPI001573B690|nr:hypothetical protein [Leisingera sp. ANG59]NSY37816.1 hypothetical protein [Leisingera sp. ANG59]